MTDTNTHEDFSPIPPSKDDATKHGLILQSQATLINLTSTFLNAEEGSQAESVAGMALEAAVDAFSRVPEFAAELLMTMAVMTCSAADPDKVQEWFDDQSEAVKGVLDGEDDAA